MMNIDRLSSEQFEMVKEILAFCILDHSMFGGGEFVYQLDYDSGIVISNPDHVHSTPSFLPVISFFTYNVPDYTHDEFSTTISSLARSLTDSLGVSNVYFDFDHKEIVTLLNDKELLKRVETLQSIMGL